MEGTERTSGVIGQFAERPRAASGAAAARAACVCVGAAEGNVLAREAGHAGRCRADGFQARVNSKLDRQLRHPCAPGCWLTADSMQRESERRLAAGVPLLPASHPSTPCSLLTIGAVDAI